MSQPSSKHNSAPYFARRRTLSRRAVLRGAAATIALPFLDIMRPLRSLAASTVTESTLQTPKRIAFMYIPNGVIGQHWFPKAEATGLVGFAEFTTS